MVVADDRYRAEDAAALIAVDYDPMDAVVDLATASGSSARVHDEVTDNVAGTFEDRTGDPDAAFPSRFCAVHGAAPPLNRTQPGESA